MVRESDDAAPAQPDGQFHDQEMPTTDGELSDADAPTPPRTSDPAEPGEAATGSADSFADVNAGKKDPNSAD